jgi:hypothetical protein
MVSFMRLALVAAAACLVLAGCSGGGPIDRNRLIDDMTHQLDSGRGIVYGAEYQLAGGSRASIGQQIEPARTVYGYPGGMIVVYGDQQTLCATTARPPKCQVKVLPTAAAGLPSSYAEATKQGFVTGPVVADLLRIALLQPSTSVKPHDATIAGQPSSCLEVSGLVDAASSAFTACVTAEGVLASFAGLVNGVNVDQALIEVSRKVSEEAFALPPGAQVVDLRQ